MNGRFDPEQDVIIQLDVIDITNAAGNRTSIRLEGRWWLPGQGDARAAPACLY